MLARVRSGALQGVDAIVVDVEVDVSPGLPQTTTVGLPDPTQILEIPAVSLVAEERTLRGSYLGSSVPARDLPRFIDLYRQGRLDVERLLTDRLALDDINEGFDRLASGAAVRQAIVFD